MNIVIFGPQASGKGTQAKLISEKLGIPNISTGEIFRKNISEGTELGKLAASFINKGNLVPDDVTNKIVEARLKEDDCKNGFILDGYPRNEEQADFLNSITKLDFAINVDLSEKEIIFRLEGRRTCTNKKCGMIFNVNTAPKPKVNGKCDKCRADLYHRDDDKPDAIKKRLKIYYEETEPLISYYNKKGILKRINGMQTIEEVFEDIVSVLK